LFLVFFVFVLLKTVCLLTAIKLSDHYSAVRTLLKFHIFLPVMVAYFDCRTDVYVQKSCFH